MNQNESFTVSQDYEIQAPAKEPAIIVPMSIWNRIRDRVKQVSYKMNWQQDAVFAAMGISLTTWVSIWSGQYKEGNALSNAKIAGWTTLLVSIALIYLCWRERSLEEERGKDIDAFMEMAERNLEEK